MGTMFETPYEMSNPNKNEIGKEVEFSPYIPMGLFCYQYRTMMRLATDRKVNQGEKTFEVCGPADKVYIMETFQDSMESIRNRAFLVGDGINEASGVFNDPHIKVIYSEPTGETLNEMFNHFKDIDRQESVFLCHRDDNKDSKDNSTIQWLKGLLASDGSLLYKAIHHQAWDGELNGYKVYTDYDAPQNCLLFGNFIHGYRIDLEPKIYVRKQKPMESIGQPELYHVKHGYDGRVTNPDLFVKFEWWEW